MNLVLLRSSAFVRNAKKIIKKQLELAANIQATLELLGSDPYDPSLRTHKLKGRVIASNFV
jgi:mRNA interferase YafQ